MSTRLPINPIEGESLDREFLSRSSNHARAVTPYGTPLLGFHDTNGIGRTEVNLPFAPQVFEGWPGVVIFRNLAGARATPTGTATGFIRCHLNDNATGLAGTVSYDDGTNLEAWPAGTQIYQISELPTGALYVG